MEKRSYAIVRLKKIPLPTRKPAAFEGAENPSLAGKLGLM